MRLEYLTVNPATTYTCHIYYWGSHQICRWAWPKLWQSVISPSHGPPTVTSALVDIHRVISVVLINLFRCWSVLCLSALVTFVPQWNIAVLLCSTWESIKLPSKKFNSRPGLWQLIQVLETSSTCRARYQLHSGLAYFAVTDNLSKAAVALSEVPAFLLLLLYCQSRSLHGLQGLPAVAAIHSVHSCTHLCADQHLQLS